MKSTNINSHYENDKYRVLSYSNLDNSNSSIKLESKLDSVLIVPFILNGNNNIKSIFVMEQEDWESGTTHYLPILKTYSSEKYDSKYDQVENICLSTFNLSEIPVNQFFYLGKITSNYKFSKKYECYSINLNDSNFNISIDHFTSNIKEIPFHKIGNDEYSDCLLLSSVLLLTTYFN
jgi:hypothetical protein